MEITGDDQVSLNRILMERNIVWDFKSEGRLKFRNTNIRISKDIAVGVGENITVGLIPFGEVPRLHLSDNNFYVKHPLTPKNNDAKKRYFQEIGLWFL